MSQHTTNTAVAAGVPVITVTLSNDKMTAYARIRDFSLPLKELLSHLKAEMLAAGIRRGLVKENIEKLVRDRDPEQKLVIARGVPPREGKKGAIVPLTEFARRAEFDIDKLSIPDIEKLKHPNLVFAGTPLLRIAPGRKSQEGYTVTGEVLKPATDMQNPEPEIELGANVAYSEKEPNVIVARCNGLAIFKDKTVIEVKPYKVIKGDAGFKYRGLKHKGNLIILGDLKAGCDLEVSGDVEVYGTMEDARIDAGRDVIIYHGFVGRGKGKIKAGRNIILGFGLYQELEAGETVLFFRELMGCKVYAGKNIVSIAGGIIGGINEALHKISIQFAGSEEAVKTELIVGRPARIKQKKQAVENKIKSCQEEIEENKNLIYELVRKQLDDEISPEEARQLAELQERKKTLPNKIRQLEEELMRINEQFKNIKNSYIEIRGTVNERVLIIINDARLLIEHKTRRKLMRLSGNAISTSML